MLGLLSNKVATIFKRDSSTGVSCEICENCEEHIIRVTGHSKTLIDNIFSNHIFKEAIWGYLTSTISDHLL